MAWQVLRYKLSSSAPLIMHNGQLADPTNKWYRAIKKISSKAKKTDADYEEMARLEFLAGLYLAPDGPVIPDFMANSMLVKAAQKSKDGAVAKSASFCPNHARLDYDGPREADSLWADERFRFSAGVVVNRARVMRMRPRFVDWGCVLEFSIEDTLVNPERVDQWMHVAGTQIGLGTWRPQNGRFTAVRLSE
jgi:hypothetical protein